MEEATVHYKMPLCKKDLLRMLKTDCLNQLKWWVYASFYLSQHEESHRKSAHDGEGGSTHKVH
eukprot:1554958-Ditylum_brightwellii.AAC.1